MSQSTHMVESVQSCPNVGVMDMPPCGECRERIGPWKTYVLVEVLYREPHDEMTNRSHHHIPDDELSDLEDDTDVLDEEKDFEKKPQDSFNLDSEWKSGEHSKNEDVQMFAYRQKDYKTQTRKGRKWTPFLQRI